MFLCSIVCCFLFVVLCKHRWMSLTSETLCFLFSFLNNTFLCLSVRTFYPENVFIMFASFIFTFTQVCFWLDTWDFYLSKMLTQYPHFHFSIIFILHPWFWVVARVLLWKNKSEWYIIRLGIDTNFPHKFSDLDSQAFNLFLIQFDSILIPLDIYQIQCMANFFKRKKSQLKW